MEVKHWEGGGLMPLQVDVYGKCGKLQCSRENETECFLKLERSHLAFPPALPSHLVIFSSLTDAKMNKLLS